jgi:phosphatidate cytidylyltransferase
MAFQWQSFKTRSLTALVFASVMLGGLLVNAWTFLILILVINAGSWLEYIKLADKVEISASNATKPNKYIFKWGGLFFISLSWALFIDFYFRLNLPAENVNNTINWLPLLVLSCMWINDTMAYMVGSLIGRTPLSAVSPKKTWEGTIGGAALTILIIGQIGRVHFPVLHYADTDLHLTLINWYVFGFLAAASGTIGDLIESKVKRMAGVKDSGSIMPGHGGFLDRFDSILLATPIIWLYLYWLS